MLGSNGDWAALTSQNERLMRSADQGNGADASPERSLPRQWDELGSQRERLVDQAELPGGLVSPPTGAGFRLAVRAA